MNIPLSIDNAALLVIDVQQGLVECPYYGQTRSNPQMEANALRLLAAWRERQLPVFIVQHKSTDPNSPLYPGKPGYALKPGFDPLPAEAHLTKTVNSAFIGTNLQARLDTDAIRTVVCCGLTAEHCVNSTVRMAANFGYTTYLAGDATAAFDATGPNGQPYAAELVHQLSLATLHGEFAQVLTTNDLLAALA